jgi:hypothetical protein
MLCMRLSKVDLVSVAVPTSSLRLGLIRFTAHYGLIHSVGLVQAHSLESCVCENGSVSGERADGSSCASVPMLIGE